MTLSADLFNQIVQALKSDNQGDREKRSAPRVGLRAMVEILLNPGSRTPPVRMRVRDLSVSGIGLMHTREVPAGSEFIARLPGGAGSPPVHISCVVAHCRQAAPETYAIGGRIIRVLSSEEAAMLAAQGL